MGPRTAVAVTARAMWIHISNRKMLQYFPTELTKRKTKAKLFHLVHPIQGASILSAQAKFDFQTIWDRCMPAKDTG